MSLQARGLKRVLNADVPDPACPEEDTGGERDRENERKAQVSFPFILHSLHASRPAWAGGSVGTGRGRGGPLEGTERNQLWPEACFLGKWSSPCVLCCCQQRYLAGQCGSLARPVRVSQARRAGCWGDGMREREGPFLSADDAEH